MAKKVRVKSYRKRDGTRVGSYMRKRKSGHMIAAGIAVAPEIYKSIKSK